MNTAFYNGAVYSGELPLKTAFLVSEGHFAAVGTDEEILRQTGAEDRRIDLQGRFVCAVTRCALDGFGPYLPDQAFTVQEALDSFTQAGARASFEETIKGRIQPGMVSDFVVLSQNPFDTEPKKLHEIKVLETWLGGKKLPL